jgi:hypothetical protein
MTACKPAASDGYINAKTEPLEICEVRLQLTAVAIAATVAEPVGALDCG